jgi:hypothetical protein
MFDEEVKNEKENTFCSMFGGGLECLGRGGSLRPAGRKGLWTALARLWVLRRV